MTTIYFANMPRLSYHDVVAEFESAADIDDADVDIGSVCSFSCCRSTIGDPPGKVLVTSRSIFLKSTFFPFFSFLCLFSELFEPLEPLLLISVWWRLLMLMMALTLLLVDVMMVQSMVLTGLIVTLSDSILLTVNVLQAILVFLVAVVVAPAAALESVVPVDVDVLDIFHVQVQSCFVSLWVEQPDVNMCINLLA